MSSLYVYNTSTHFANGVHVGQLFNEIRKDPEIQLVNNVSGPTAGEVKISFSNDLSSEEEQVLDSIVASHIPKDESEIVVVKEERIPTGGNYAYDTIAFTAAANTTTIYNMPEEDKWKIPINVTSIEYVTKSEHEGDEFQVAIGIDSNVGPIAANASAGASSVVVASAQSLPYLMAGYMLKLSDGTNTDDVGMILSVDTNTMTVNFDTPTTHAFSAATPTYLLVTRVMAGRQRFIEIGPAWNYRVGDEKIGASYLPAGTDVKITYINKTGTDKRFVILVNYLY